MSTLSTPSIPKKAARVRAMLWCVACLAVSVLLTIIAVRCLPGPLEPLPEIFVEVVTDKQRSDLSPKVREFLQKIEARQVSGKPASDFADVLSEADETEDGKRFKIYFFSLDGHAPSIEDHPFIFAMVESKTGRIIRCGVSSRCW
jgi:hypothetical protein